MSTWNGGVIMQEIVASILTAAVAPLMGLLVWQMQRLITKKDHSDKAMKLMLRVMMEDKHEKFMHQHYINSDELAEFKEMYDVYHALGGNGRGTVWVNDVESLERRE